MNFGRKITEVMLCLSQCIITGGTQCWFVHGYLFKVVIFQVSPLWSYYFTFGVNKYKVDRLCWNYVNICFSSHIHPLILACVHDSYVKQILISSFILLLVGIGSKEKLSLFPSLYSFIHSFISLWWTLGILIFSRGYNLLVPFSLMLKLAHIWPVGIFLSCLLFYFHVFSSSLSTSLLSLAQEK